MFIILIWTLPHGTLFDLWVSFWFSFKHVILGYLCSLVGFRVLAFISFVAVFIFWVVSRLLTFTGFVTAFGLCVVSIYWLACSKSSFDAVLLLWVFCDLNFRVSLLRCVRCAVTLLLINSTVWKDCALVVCFNSRLFYLYSFLLKCKTEKLLLISVLFIFLNICHW